MRASTSLHGDYAGSLLGHEREDFLARELLTESHAAVGAGAVRLKGSFCKVKADNANFVHGCPLPFVGCANIATLAHRDAVGRGHPLHHIVPELQLLERLHRPMAAAEAMDRELRLAAGSSVTNGLCGLATCHTRRIAAS